jgi:Xaa-Pro dipeptidase
MGNLDGKGLFFSMFCSNVQILPPSAFKEMYEVDEAFYVDEIASFLKKNSKRVIYRLKGKNTDSGNEAKPAEFDGIKEFELDDNLLFREIVECRVFKTIEEIELLRYVNKISWYFFLFISF